MTQSYSVNGVRMDLDTSEAIQGQMAAGNYEPAESKWVRRHLRPGSVFVDVGANFGWFTTLALSCVGSSGHVFAFEPSPVAFATLRRALGRYGNVTLINAAVGRQPGEITIYLPNSGPVHSPSVFASPGDFRGERVPMVSLDRCEALSDVPIIDMVKIDVEGSEPDVVDGMKGLIAAGRVHRVLCEFNSGWLKMNNTSVDQLAVQFRELGLDVEASTPWQTGPASDGGLFHVQDVLYRHRSAPRGNRYLAKARALFKRAIRN
jgi:FkbM family methyltransferase